MKFCKISNKMKNGLLWFTGGTMSGGGILLTGEEKKKIASLCQEEMKRLTGKGPTQIVVTAAPGFINIRCDGFMTHFEKELNKCENGEQTIVALRKKLFDNEKGAVGEKIGRIVSGKPTKVFVGFLPNENSQSFSIVF